MYGQLLGAGMADVGSNFAAAGSYLGAIAGNRAGRQARDWYDMRTGEGSGRFGIAGFGYEPWMDLVTASQYTQGTPEQRAAAAGRFGAATGGPILDQFDDITRFSEAEGGNAVGGYRADTQRLRGIADEQVGKVQTGYKSARDTTLGDFDRGAQGIYGMIGDYGKGREKIIDEDAADAERDANDRAAIALTSAGLGNSTALGNQYAANATERGRTVTRAKQDLGDAQIALKTNVGTNLTGQRAGLQSNLFSQALGAQERGGAGIVDLEGSRSSGLSNLYEKAVDRNLQFKLMKPNMLYSMMGSNVTNPWLGQQTSQYYPGYSPVGSALVSKGNAMTTAGGYGMSGGFGF